MEYLPEALVFALALLEQPTTMSERRDQGEIRGNMLYEE